MITSLLSRIQQPTRVSLGALILANLVPVFGVLFLGWDLFLLMLLYWMESAVVGFYTVLRIVKIARIFAILFIPFFIFHYGAFMTVHLAFILSLFGSGGDDIPIPPFSPVFLSDVPLGIWFALLSLFVSHGVSFVRNFMGSREFQLTNTAKQMAMPYRRIVVMHLTIIFGGWFILVVGAPIGALIIMIFLKIFFDARAHIREHTI
jgi:hypothetical protein